MVLAFNANFAKYRLKFIKMTKAKKHIIIRITINVICLLFALGSSIDYAYRSRIMNDLGPIQDFVVVDSIYCGRRSSSEITLSYKNKLYYVRVGSKVYKSDYKRNLRYFYHEKRDMIFEEHTLEINIIVFFYIFFVISLLIWHPKVWDIQ